MQLSTVLSAFVTVLAGSAMAVPVTSPVALNKRSSAVFVTWYGSDCTTTGTVYTTTGQPIKGNVSPQGKSFQIQSMDSGDHLDFYTGENQSGTKNRYSQDVVGECIDLTYLSFGLYAN